MRLEADPDLRRLNGGRVLLGGSPLTFLRLSERGAEVVEQTLAGRPPPETPAVRELWDRLVDLGMATPVEGTDPSPCPPGSVTVVVPVRDRIDELDRCLAAIAAASGDGLQEVIVVDDGSRDPAAVAAVATAHGASVVRREESGGPGAARNSGLARVTTPLVAVVDSDVTVGLGWLDALSGPIAAGAAVAAPRVVTPDDPATADHPVDARCGGPRRGSLRARYEALRSPLDLGGRAGPVRAASRRAYVPAACWLARTDVVREVGGFDESIRHGEDVDLVWRLVEAGHRVWFCGDQCLVEHPMRSTATGWWRQRVDYGSSAAPLDRRHPGAVRPVGVSGWSVAVWAAAVAGRPVVAGAIVAGTTAALQRRLSFLDDAWSESARLVVRGHLGAGELIGRALIRPWWPVTLALAFGSRRARRVALLAAVVPPWLEHRRRRPPIPAPAWIAISVADDVAYSTGVWLGAVRERRIGSLLPRLIAWPGR